MSIFDVNFNNQGLNMLPPNKRQTGILGLLYSMLNPLQWRHDINFNTYSGGAYTYSAYNPASTYTIGERVVFNNVLTNGVYGDNGIYEAAGNVPINTPPIAANIINSNGVGSWILVQSNFIGAIERAFYTCSKLLFEFALNRWFHTTFRQPNIGVSDIYISQLDDTNDDFYGAPDQGTYFGYKFNDATSEYGMLDNTGGISAYDFIINVPTAVYNSLSANAGQREGIVRAFADKINCAGMIYEVLTY